MTRSIFDPSGGETEHSGGRFTGPAADNNSHMPPSVVDGEVSEEEAAEQERPAEKSILDRTIGQKDLDMLAHGTNVGNAEPLPSAEPIPPRRGNENEA